MTTQSQLEKVATDIPTPPSPTSKTGHILVVDDDASTRSALTYVLKHLGHRVSEVDHGQACLDQVKQETFDLIMLDYLMPGLDGISILASLKRTPATAKIPVILMTKYASRELETRCRSMGVADFFFKGNLNLNTLSGKIQKAMRQAYHPPDQQAPAHHPIIHTKAWEQAVQSLVTCTAHETRQTVKATDMGLIFSNFQPEIKQLSDDQILKCARLVELEPGAICRILADANQDLNPHELPIHTIPAAVSKLGVPRVQAIIAAMPLIELDPITRPWILQSWCHAIAVSYLAQVIAPAMGLDPDMARATGMLHDLGRLQLLVSHLGHTTLKIYDLARNMILPVVDCEQMMLGLDHSMLGAELCERWQLPPLFSRGCLDCHSHSLISGTPSTPEQLLKQVLCTADQLASATGFGSLPSHEIDPLSIHAIQITNNYHVQIEQMLDKAHTTCLWWMGRPRFQGHDATINATGLRILIISPNTGPWYPLRLVLAQAGAHVVTYENFTKAQTHLSPLDLVILDHTATSLRGQINTLRQATKHFSPIPQLLLARRSDDPEDLVHNASLDLNLYTTPIRVNSLLQAINRLTAPIASGDSEA